MSDLGFVPLTPTAFLVRSATVFADRLAVVDGPARWTYRELLERSTRLAGALHDLGVEPGDRVAALAPNSAMLLEAHHGVPFAGAVLVAMNTRLAARELGYILDHADAKVLLLDASLRGVGMSAVQESGRDIAVVMVGGGDDRYEALLAGTDPVLLPVTDERSLLALNYTSGTTGHPKGVRYHHRGAYLQSLAMAFHSHLGPDTTFLWTLPMFHCNGWCYTWAVTAAGGVHRCLRALDPAEVWRAIADEGVTHFNAAPTVLTMLADDPGATPAPRPIAVATGGAPPSPTLLDRMASLNIEITHLYGLTETFGPSVVCEPQPEWRDLPTAEQAQLKARQGVTNILGGGLRVVDEKGDDVDGDGTTIGQIALQGNNVMAGYHLDPEATAASSLDGWFLSGDLGVLHGDGYIELKDRAKDIVITGGENVSTVEVEQALCSHPSVSEAAVVGRPDDLWGEVPVAFVALRPGVPDVSVQELQAHVRSRLAGFKVPKAVTFGELPKTSTGKIQKFVLRERVHG